ncbi:MAG: hypothetical protein WC905_00680 [Patescibacteria group bacterium]|jgi:hypothetical protein
MNKIKSSMNTGVVAIFVIVLAFLLRVLIGVNFWLVLGLVALFGICTWLYRQTLPDPAHPDVKPMFSSGLRVLVNVSRVLVVLFLAGALIEAGFPRFFKQATTTGKAIVDQEAAGLMGNKTRTMAKDIWNIQADNAGQAFLVYYNSLLSHGLTQQAADTLAKFNRHWDSDLLKEAKESSSSEGQSVSASVPDPAPSILPEGQTLSSSSISESFTFNKEGETWLPKHFFQKGEEIIYKIENFSTILVDRDGTQHALPPGKYGGLMIEAGSPTFLSQFAGAKITVFYNI